MGLSLFGSGTKGEKYGKHGYLPLPPGKAEKLREAKERVLKGELPKGAMLKLSKSNLAKMSGAGWFSDLFKKAINVVGKIIAPIAKSNTGILANAKFQSAHGRGMKEMAERHKNKMGKLISSEMDKKRKERKSSPYD